MDDVSVRMDIHPLVYAETNGFHHEYAWRNRRYEYTGTRGKPPWPPRDPSGHQLLFDSIGGEWF